MFTYVKHTHRVPRLYRFIFIQVGTKRYSGLSYMHYVVFMVMAFIRTCKE